MRSIVEIAKYAVSENLTNFETGILRYLADRKSDIQDMWKKSIKEANVYKKNDIETIKSYFNDFVGRYVFDYMREHTTNEETTELVEDALCDVNFWKIINILIAMFDLKGGAYKWLAAQLQRVLRKSIEKVKPTALTEKG